MECAAPGIPHFSSPSSSFSIARFVYILLTFWCSAGCWCHCNPSLPYCLFVLTHIQLKMKMSFGSWNLFSHFTVACFCPRVNIISDFFYGGTNSVASSLFVQVFYSLLIISPTPSLITSGPFSGQASLLLRYRLKCVVINHVQKENSHTPIPHVKNLDKNSQHITSHILVSCRCYPSI